MHMNNWFAWVGFFIHSISGYRNRKHTILLLFKEPKIQLTSHFLGVLNVAQREEEREEKKKNQLVSCHKFYDKCSKKKISISVWSWLRWRWRKKKAAIWCGFGKIELKRYILDDFECCFLFHRQCSSMPVLRVISTMLLLSSKPQSTMMRHHLLTRRAKKRKIKLNRSMWMISCTKREIRGKLRLNAPAYTHQTQVFWYRNHFSHIFISSKFWEFMCKCYTYGT